MKKNNFIFALMFSVITVFLSHCTYAQADSTIVASTATYEVQQATASLDSVFEMNDSLQHVADSLINASKPSVNVNVINQIFGNSTVVSPVKSVMYILIGFLLYCIIYFRKAYHDNFKLIGSFNFAKWFKLNYGSVIMYAVFIGAIIIKDISLPINGALLLGLMPKMIINAIKKEFDSLSALSKNFEQK